jgi:DNA-binding response OmpR family regulator
MTSKIKVLIVEDSEEIIELLKIVINPEVDVTFALDFKEAKAYLKNNHPDVVMTDWNFPYGNGDEVAELARANGCKRIILHSGSLQYKEKLYDEIIEKTNIKQLQKALKFGKL